MPWHSLPGKPWGPGTHPGPVVLQVATHPRVGLNRVLTCWKTWLLFINWLCVRERYKKMSIPNLLYKCLIRSQDRGSNEELTLLFVHEKKIVLLPQKRDVSFYVNQIRYVCIIVIIQNKKNFVSITSRNVNCQFWYIDYCLKWPSALCMHKSDHISKGKFLKWPSPLCMHSSEHIWEKNLLSWLFHHFHLNGQETLRIAAGVQYLRVSWNVTVLPVLMYLWMMGHRLVQHISLSMARMITSGSSVHLMCNIPCIYVSSLWLRHTLLELNRTEESWKREKKCLCVLNYGDSENTFNYTGNAL